MKIIFKITIILTCITVLAGCGTTLTRRPVPEGRAAPSWYKGADPKPSEEYYYFTGYSEKSHNFSQARRLAEKDARTRVGEFIGSEITAQISQDLEEYGSDWSQVLYEDDPGSGVKDAIKTKMDLIVSERIQKARVKDIFTMEVSFKKFMEKPRIYYDCGVLLEYPRSEAENIMDEDLETEMLLGRIERIWQAGEKKKAIEMMEEAVRKHPLDERLSYLLGRYYKDAGRTNDAKIQFASLDENNQDSAWSKKAKAELNSLASLELNVLLDSLESHGVSGRNLVDVIKWLQVGKLSRARSLTREQYESNGDSELDLWVWYIASSMDYYSSQSKAAQYEYQKAKKLTQKDLQQWNDSKDAEDVISMLLMVATTGKTGREIAVDELQRVKSKIGKQEFPNAIADSAVTVFNDSSDDKQVNKLVDWLNGS